MRDFCGRHPEELRWTSPSGGSTAFVEIVGGSTKMSSSASVYARELFDAAKVSATPSTLFVDAGDGHVRVTYGRRDTGLVIDAWEGWIASST